MKRSIFSYLNELALAHLQQTFALYCFWYMINRQMSYQIQIIFNVISKSTFFYGLRPQIERAHIMISKSAYSRNQFSTHKYHCIDCSLQFRNPFWRELFFPSALIFCNGCCDFFFSFTSVDIKSRTH